MTTPSEDGRAALLEEAIRRKRAAAGSAAPGLPPRPAGRPARLSELQRGLWLWQRLEPDSAAYHLTSAFRVDGELDAAALERAFNQVVARHRLLRSTFRRLHGSVLQVVEPHSPRRVERLTATPGEATWMAIRETRRPFDLESGPLVRLLWIEAPDERLLVLALHHILADERSLAVLWRELAAAYRGEEPAAAAEPQYDDFVHWREAGDRRRDADLDYWRRHLKPPPDDLELPFERPPAAAPSTRGRLLGRRLPAGLRRRLKRLAAATGGTPFSVLAFAFRLLLHRYTEGREVAFATPASMRSHPVTAEMIGYFLNPVVIAAAIDEGLSVERAVREFGERSREALAHASVPFDALVEELGPRRRRDRHPLFQAMFVHQETPPAPELGGPRLEPVSLDLGESKFDLTLFATEGAEGLEIAVEYRTDRFEERWMEKLLGHYATLVESLTEDPARRVEEVAMLPEAERAAIRTHARGEPLESSRAPLVPRRILERARAAPAAPAVIAGGERWSYAELESAALRIAAELGRRGVGAGDRVGLFLDRSPRLIAAVLGCHLAGAAYVPLDPAYPSERSREVLEDAEVAAVLTCRKVAERCPRPAAPVDIAVIDVETLDGDELAEAVQPPAEPPAETPAYLMYTSGSTGRPKGVVVTQGNLRASTEARLAAYDVAPERFLLLPSVAFDSSVAGLFWTLAAGGALVLPSDEEARDPRRLVRLVREERVTGLLCVPSLYVLLLEALTGDPALEIAIVAGESCPAALVAEHFRRLPRTRLFNEYGPTETTVWATVEELRRPAEGARAVPIGRPVPGVTVEVLDAHGRRLPAGIPGEGWIAGPTLAEGYWRRPELTLERFARRSIEGEEPRRMYRSGDRLSWTEDGRLLFLGRVDEQIKLRGFRIEPGEIGAALEELPGVEEAAVVLREGERLVAFVTGAAQVEDLPDRLAGRLPAYMVPGRAVRLPELPRLPNGKVDRRRLRELPLEAPAPRPAAASPAAILGDRGQALVSLWEGLLGRSGISPTDNFFQLGGHSLLAVEMTAAIERDFDVTLAPAEVFQSPTIAELLRRIEEKGGAGPPSYRHLFPIQPGGAGSPFLFCVPHFFTPLFAAHFRGERPVYGLRGVSLRAEGNRGRWPSMRELGAELVEEICRRFPDRRYLVAGYSFGATMAVEAVRQMEERGLPVERLYLIAPMPLDVYRLGPVGFEIDGLRRPLAELSTGEALRRVVRTNHPLSRRFYQRAFRLLAIQPWRRLLCLLGRLRTRVGLPLTERILYADVRLERFRLHVGYRPGVLRTPTVFFNAREPETDAAATWRPWFAGPLTVHQIPDPHLDEESVRAAGELILEHLREPDGASADS